MSHVLLGITGGIAAVKTPPLVRQLIEIGHKVRCVMTKAATEFVTPLSLATLSGHQVHWNLFDETAYEMPHLTLAKEADVMVIAPTSAGTLGRCAHGIAEDMVTLAYITTKAPILMAPAMHDTMWNHASTQENVKILKSQGVHFVGPVQGKLANQDEAVGRMSEVEDIIKAIKSVVRRA